MGRFAEGKRSRTKRSRANRGPKARRQPLGVESLEERALPSVTIGINDVSVTEGDAAIRYIDDFVSAGSGGIANPHEIAFGPDGYLYVASGLTDQVLRFDPHSGAFVDAPITSGSSGVVLDNPWGLVFGPDNKLYVSGALSNNVVRYDPTTAAVDEFVASGSGLWTPKGLAFDSNGTLYVSNADRGGADTSLLQDQVVRFQGPSGPSPGQLVDVFIAKGDHGLDNNNNVNFNGNYLYVSNTRGDSIYRYEAATGAFHDVLVAPNSGGLDVPTVLSFRSGYLYVTSQGTCQVLRYNASTGEFADAFVTAGTTPETAGGHVFDVDGNLYLAKSGNKVVRYGPASQAAFTVSLDAPSSVPVTVNYATANANAQAGSDFAAVSGTLTFAPGETTKTVLVPTLDDAVFEGDETFTVNLSDPVGAAIADGQGVATIHDNDPAPTILGVTSTTANGTYGVGATINITVSFSEPVTLAGGNLTINLDSGGTVTIAPFGPATSASGTYTVQAGQHSSDLNTLSPLVLASGATLRNAANYDVSLLIPAGQSLANNKDLVIATLQPIPALISNVQALVTSGVLNNGQGNALLVKLEHSMQHLDSGRVTPAVNGLGAFVNQVNAFISADVLTSAEGQPLIDAANALIALLTKKQ